MKNNIDEIESLIRSIAENVYTLYQEIIGEPKLDDENEKIN